MSVVGFIAYDFQGMGKFSKTFLPWDLSPNTYAFIVMGITAIYVLLGGMISVVITDLAQFIIMAVCAVIVAGIAMAKVSAPSRSRPSCPAGWDNIFFGWKLDIDWSHAHPVAPAEPGRGRVRVLRVLLHRDGLQGACWSASPARRRTTTCSGSWQPRRRARRAS